MTGWECTTCGGRLSRLRHANESGYDYKFSITNSGDVMEEALGDGIHTVR
jgi:hypothetical protein